MAGCIISIQFTEKWETGVVGRVKCNSNPQEASFLSRLIECYILTINEFTRATLQKVILINSICDRYDFC